MEMIIEFAGDKEREIGFYLEDNDTLKFQYSDGGDETSTKKVLISELFQVLKDSSDYRKKWEREQKDTEIKGWIDRCQKLEDNNKKLKEENWQRESEIQSLKETIRIVGKK